jgi:hypothetical protein
MQQNIIKGKIVIPEEKKTKTGSSAGRRFYEMDEAGKRQFGSTERPEKVCPIGTNTNGFLKTAFLPKLKECSTTSNLSKSKTIKLERIFINPFPKCQSIIIFLNLIIKILNFHITSHYL